VVNERIQDTRGSVLEKKRSVIRREDDVDGRASVTKDEERVLRGGWTLRVCKSCLIPGQSLFSLLHDSRPDEGRARISDRNVDVGNLFWLC